MTWLHPALLAGLGLVAIPVLLHFLMRQKPRKLIFPALRLVQQQRRQNSRRFRLRHLWLLLLRMAALAAIVFAIARPTLPAANYGLNLRESLTLGSVIAAGVAAYWLTLLKWRSQPWPRYEFNLKRTKLRGWVTGGTIVLALLLAGWPYERRVAAEITSPAPLGQFDLPVAAIYIFDTSLSLQYTQEGKNRLDVAKDLAKAHLQDFPAGSRLAVADCATDSPVIFQASTGAAQSRIDALELSAVSVPINDRLTASMSLQSDDRKRVAAEGGDAAKDRFIRRIYVFTDLSATAWRFGESTAIARSFEELPGLSVQIVDVGELTPRNTAITGLFLSRQQLNVDSPLQIGGELAATGESGERKAVLSLLSAAGQPVPRDSQSVNLEPGQPQRFDFALLNNLAGPVVHGEVRLQSSDPLQFDDVRTFTVLVGRPPKVVLVAPLFNETTEVRTALDFVGYEPVVITPLQLATADLSKYQVAFLLNVPDLSDDTWNKLGSFVSSGGGLAVVLGSDSIDSPSYNRGAAQQFLPARLDVHQLADSKTPLRFSVERKDHPLFWKFRQLDSGFNAFAVFENDMNIYRFWKTMDRAGDATIAAIYSDSDHSPALLDRPHGRGRTVMFTTSMHLTESNRRRWNDLPSPNKEPWQWLAFVEQLAGYLSRATDWQVNITAGEVAALPIEPAVHDREMLLQRPAFAQSKVTVKAQAAEVTTSETRDPGQYSLIIPGQSVAVSGFSVNPSSAESDLKRATPEQFDELLGKGRFQIARTLDEIKADVNVSDLGKEVFPLVLLLAILAFCGEHFVANWFYEADNERTTAPERPGAGET